MAEVPEAAVADREGTVAVGDTQKLCFRLLLPRVSLYWLVPEGCPPKR